MIAIDHASGEPLTDQIAGAIRAEIAAGRIAPGDELPTVRQLADDLEVNFNTVARAYRVLESSGLVRSARGRGSRVVSAVETNVAGARRGARRSIGVALTNARLAGLDRQQIENVLNAVVDQLWPQEEAP